MKTYIYFDDNVKPCSLNVLDVDNNKFLTRRNVMCNFYQVTLEPQEKSVEFGSVIEQNSVSYEYPSYWKFSHSIIITTCVACGSQLFIYFVCPYWTFEEKSALLIGCTVSSTDNPQIIIMNQDTYKSLLTKPRQFNLLQKRKIQSTLDDSKIHQSVKLIMYHAKIQIVVKHWSVRCRSKLLNLLDTKRMCLAD